MRDEGGVKGGVEGGVLFIDKAGFSDARLGSSSLHLRLPIEALPLVI